MNGWLDVLVVDDERPTVDMLEHFLRAEPRIRRVHTSLTAKDALRILHDEVVDAVFLDIHMPGLTGLDLAHAIRRFRHPPAIVFVTADEDQGIKAFDLDAVDYILKPVSQERLGRAVSRLRRHPEPPGEVADSRMVPVERGGVRKLIRHEDIQYAEAAGDYVRMHTRETSYLVRSAISTLEQAWEENGFVRIHRSYLVALRHVQEVAFGPGSTGSVLVGGVRLPVSRRNAPVLRQKLQSARIGGTP